MRFFWGPLALCVARVIIVPVARTGQTLPPIQQVWHIAQKAEHLTQLKALKNIGSGKSAAWSTDEDTMKTQGYRHRNTLHQYL